MTKFVVAGGFALALVGAAPAQDRRGTLTLEMLERMDRRLEAMTTQQQQAVTHMASVAGEVKALRTDMGRYQSRVEELERRVAALEARPAAPGYRPTVADTTRVAYPPADLTVPALGLQPGA